MPSMADNAPGFHLQSGPLILTAWPTSPHLFTKRDLKRSTSNPPHLLFPQPSSCLVQWYHQSITLLLGPKPPQSSLAPLTLHPTTPNPISSSSKHTSHCSPFQPTHSEPSRCHLPTAHSISLPAVPSLCPSPLAESQSSSRCPPFKNRSDVSFLYAHGSISLRVKASVLSIPCDLPSVLCLIS